MGFVKEFKEFAVKGNAIDLAVGVIIGAAFGKIVTSIIEDLVMPVVSKIIGQPDFSKLWVDLNAKAASGLALADAKKVQGSDIFAYGNFITVAINFLLIAVVIFMMVKGINKLKKKQAEAPAAAPAPTNEEVLLTEIRDALRNK
ncbi:large conductance mechanosensitive channel protein MscL [Arachidicoccus sp.]|jgi:large conductance mechanosensitive channel|uniref:large conductance mechanosensitive channel protein MscL n=1 Tax=Arachidicoccus sp. TaxID=1872624 RepID=UPI003D1DA599